MYLDHLLAGSEADHDSERASSPDTKIAEKTRQNAIIVITRIPVLIKAFLQQRAGIPDVTITPLGNDRYKAESIGFTREQIKGAINKRGGLPKAITLAEESLLEA